MAAVGLFEREEFLGDRRQIQYPEALRGGKIEEGGLWYWSASEMLREGSGMGNGLTPHLKIPGQLATNKVRNGT